MKLSRNPVLLCLLDLTSPRGSAIHDIQPVPNDLQFVSPSVRRPSATNANVPVGNLWDFLFKQKRPWEVVAKYGERYGRMSVFWIFNQPAIVLNDAALIREVMISRTQDFYKDEPCGALIPVLTRSSPNINNGDEWTRTRRQSPLTQPWIGEWHRRRMASPANVGGAERRARLGQSNDGHDRRGAGSVAGVRTAVDV